MNRPIAIDLTEADIHQALTSKRGLWREVFRDPVLGFCVGVVGTLLANGQFRLQFALVALPVWLGVTLWYYFQRNRRFDREVRREVSYYQRLTLRNGPLFAMIDADALTMIRGTRRNRIAWPRIRTWRELPDVIIVGQEILPKRLLSKEQLSYLRQGLERHAKHLG